METDGLDVDPPENERVDEEELLEELFCASREFVNKRKTNENRHNAFFM